MKDFQDAVIAARDYAHGAGFWDPNADVTWEVNRLDKGDIPNLAGPSMGLAFALAFVKLHVGEGSSGEFACECLRFIAGVHLESVAASATISRNGNPGKIGGIAPKLFELLTNRNCYDIRALLVAHDQDDCLNPVEPPLSERRFSHNAVTDYVLYRRDGDLPLVVIPVTGVADAFRKLFEYQALSVLEI